MSIAYAVDQAKRRGNRLDSGKIVGTLGEEVGQTAVASLGTAVRVNLTERWMVYDMDKRLPSSEKLDGA
jgi:hypothetical protein